MPFAARPTDPVMHPLPPVLTPGPGSLNVLIGGLPAWRGIPALAAAALQAAKEISDTAIEVAEAATLAAAGTPGAPAALAAEQTTKATCATTMGSMISSMAGMADIHMCATPLPLPPHGPGVVIDGSPTVLINGLPACRMGDTILEAVGPPNEIAMGCPTVIIGESGGGGGSVSGSPGSSPSPSSDDDGDGYTVPGFDSETSTASGTTQSPGTDKAANANAAGGTSSNRRSRNQIAQVASMRNAAKSGAPFCAMCELMKRLKS